MTTDLLLGITGTLIMIAGPMLIYIIRLEKRLATIETCLRFLTEKEI